MSQNVSKIREKAALLVAEDRLCDEKIAEACEVTRRTIVRWRSEPKFALRVREIAAAYAERALNHGLARKERRLAVLNELHDKMLTVIAERAESADLADVPGGKTGLVTKMLKGIGKGDDFQVVEVYEVDTGTVKEIRALQQQVAEELGQRVDRTETVDLNKLFERMTSQELEAYARDGALPKWFPVHTQPETIQ